MIVCVIIIVILVALLVFCCYHCFRLAKIVLNMEDAINESLDVLNTSYVNIGKVLETPIGSDDPYIKGVINEIKRSQEAILVIANQITEGWESEEKDE
jgi:hypothetical protein